MVDSILDDTKQICGLEPNYTHYDLDIILHINSVFSTLNQLGAGPPDGFEITGSDEVWDDFTGGDPKLNSVRTYVVLKVKSLFDPPTTSYLIGAMEKQLAELEWRINVLMEETIWVDPMPVLVEE